MIIYYNNEYRHRDSINFIYYSIGGIKMLQVKEYCTVENKKVEQGVQDWLTRGYHDIFIESITPNEFVNKNAFTNICECIKRMLKETGYTKKEYIKWFFETSIQEDIVTTKHWVNYLDTHMEERYVEDGEILYSYDSDLWSPLAIRGSKEEVKRLFSLMLLAINVDFKLEDLNLDMSSLKESFDSDNYEEEGGNIDRPYYEQRARSYTI